MDGSGRHHTSGESLGDMNDVLLNLEQSMEDQLYAGGMLSQFTLGTSDLSSPIAFTRNESLESSVGSHHSDGNTPQSIFRVPSEDKGPPSPSRYRSPPKSPNMRDTINGTYSPTKSVGSQSGGSRSGASDSTDTTNNLHRNTSTLSTSDSQSILDQIARPPTGVISPLHSPPATKPNKRRKRNQNTNKRGNNLVILPTPSKEHVRRKSTTAVLASSNELPPPHPMSHAQSYPAHGHTRHATIARIDSMASMGSETGSEATPIISPGRISRGCYSYSVDSGDERSYSDEGESDLPAKGVSEEPHVSMQGAPLLVPLSDSTGKELQGLTISFVDESDDCKRGESDPQCAHDEPTPRTNHATSFDKYRKKPVESTQQFEFTGQIANTQSNQSGSSGKSETSSQDIFPLLLNLSQNPAEGPQQVFSSDNLFFEGIYNSGLQSTSFEHVTDKDLSVSTEKEIELVFDGSFEEIDDRSVDEKSADMSRRVELWRKSRLRNSNENLLDSSDGDEREHSLEKPNSKDCVVDAVKAVRKELEISAAARTCGPNSFEDCEEETYGVEMAPLTKSTAASSSDASPSSGDHPPRSAEIHQSSRHFAWQWRFSHPLIALRNSLWRIQIESAPALENIREDRTSSPVPELTEEPMQRSLTRIEDEDFDERRSLTSPIHRSPLRTTRRYDDVDFDRSTNLCCYCIAKWCVSRNERDPYGLIERETYKAYTSWKKLCLVSLFMVLLAWLVTGGRLQKHHLNYQGLDEYENDPLSREHFIERSRVAEDGDDYYLLSLTSPTDDDDAFHSFEKQIVLDQFRSDDEYVLQQPNIREHDFASSTAERYNPMTFNDYVGIDTISVLGERHTHVEWLVARLTEVYPELRVLNGLPSDTNSARRRRAKIYDPVAHKIIDQDLDQQSINQSTEESNRVLVVAVFLNPYDWIELMHIDPDPAYGTSFKDVDWREFVDQEIVSAKEERLYDNILSLRSDRIRSFFDDSTGLYERVKLVIPVRYEDLASQYEGIYYRASDGSTAALPGIVGLMDEIQERTGLRPNENAGWLDADALNLSSRFWADEVGCNGHICLFTGETTHDPEYIEFINTHLDFQLEYRIGYTKRSRPKPHVDEIVVLGERHSGAEFLVTRLQRCFPGVKVAYGFDSRPGKFFQSDSAMVSPNTLVISVFMNPYDWVELMRLHPINAPAHRDMEWDEFVTTSWERKRSNLDETLMSSTIVDDVSQAHCSFGFHFHEIIPCLTKRDPNTDTFPLYEMQPGNGEPYSSIIHLREDKITSFLQAVSFDGVVADISVRYEDLLWEEGTGSGSPSTLPFPGIAGLLEKIRDETSLVPDMDAGWILDEDDFFKAVPLASDKALDPYYAHWMEVNVNWDVEALVGYVP